MHECFPKQWRMGTARMKEDKETDEDGKKRGLSIERRKAGTKKRSPEGLTQPNQNIIIIIYTMTFILHQRGVVM